MTDLSAPEFPDLDDLHRDSQDGEYAGLPDPAGSQPLEVGRNGVLAAAIGGVAALIGLAYLTRALGEGAWLDWSLAALMGLIGAAYLSAFLDSRVPILVADTYGVRLRLGRTWRGVPWTELDCIEHEPRRGLLRDGHLVLVAEDPDSLLAGLDRAGRRQVALAQRLHGSPVAIPLGLSTRVTGAGDDLTATLVELAGDPDRVVLIVDDEIEDAAEDWAEGSAADSAVDWAEGSAADWVADTSEDRTEIRLPNWDEPLTTPRDEDPAAAAGDEWAEAWSADSAVDPGADPGAAAPAPLLPDPRPRLARTIDRLAGMLRLPGRTGAADQPTGDDAAEGEAALPEVRDDVDSLPSSTERPDQHLDETPRLADAEHDDRDPAGAGPEPTVPLAVSPSPSAAPIPLREPVAGIRAEVRLPAAERLHDAAAERLDETAAAPWLGDAQDGEHTQVLGPQPLLIDGYAEALEPGGQEVEEDTQAVRVPVIGPQLAAAREQLHLSVDQLAERTRIRPHVIESIEIDDFAPCGGDFYARGHLRTLARVLGVDAAPLLADYDERHAAEPIAARQVFEAELAIGADGPIRSARGGPNWSVLVAAVMALVLAWSIARLIMDSPVTLEGKPVLNGSPSQPVKLGPALPVILHAAEGGVHVVVRDGAGEIVFDGDLSYDQKRQLKATPPVQIQSSDGGLQVTVDGQPRGALGTSGQPATSTYIAAD